MEKIKLSDSHARRMAELKGEPFDGTKEEAYMRDPDGGWIIVYEDSGERFGVIDCRAEIPATKSGRSVRPKHDTPDPVGFELAKRVVELWNSNL